MGDFLTAMTMQTLTMMLKSTSKKLCPKVVLRTLSFIFILGLCGFITFKVCLMHKQTMKSIIWEVHHIQNKSFSEIEATSRLIPPLNTSAMNVARSLSSIVNGTQLSFATIQAQVAPRLFLVLSTVPHIYQVSYMGSDGLLFAYCNNEDQTFAVYSNTSSSSLWYTQPVNRDTGKLYGDAVSLKSRISVHTGWFKQALNSTVVFSSLGTAWDTAQTSLVKHAVAMDGRGVITLGFPAQRVVEHFAALDFHGGHFHLTSADGGVIVQSDLPNTQIVVYNSTVSVQTSRPNGDSKGNVGNISCKSDDGKLISFHVKIMGIKHRFYCHSLQIAGIPSVYVLAYSRHPLVGLVNRNGELSVILLVLMYAAIFISIGIFMYCIVRAAKRELFLCVSLIKQMQATEQAERKSMNKTKAFTSANHDVRACLAGITGLIELCHEDANPRSKLAENLVQMKSCTKDLLVLLNSVLEMSKIEAGKLELEEEEFNMAQLLEETVDLFYPVGMKKGLDVVLDLSDDSIVKAPMVRGDRVKLKQILCNLINNAVKFTAEGHVVVRGAVKKTSFENEIIASNQNVLLKCLSRLFYKNKEDFKDLDALQTVEKNPNQIEFEFEVEDTGKGIPKEKQTSIFEDFCQVKEKAFGQEHCGTGLGLGIVQSLVRLMHGDIRIIDKEPGERGCLFRFNIFVTACETEPVDSDEENPRTNNNGSPNGLQHHFPLFRAPALKPDGSHVVLFILGEERKRMLKKYIESLNIKVTIIKQGKNLLKELDKLKRKLDPPCHSYSGKSESSWSENRNKCGSSGSDSGGKDRNDHVLPAIKKSSSKDFSGFTLLVIDTSASTFSELCSAVANFRKDMPASFYKVVWLDNPVTRIANGREIQEELPALPCDYILNKPLHGSRLYQILGLLPGWKVTSRRQLPNLKMGTTAQDLQHAAVESNLTNESNYSGLEAGTSSQYTSLPSTSTCRNYEKSNENPLNGKKILVVDDVDLLRKLTANTLNKLGATSEVCSNGKEALDQICEILRGQKKEGQSTAFPYDFILMDCEMPGMDGYEATTLIRKEEEQYDVHIPIIALTCHAMTEQTKEILQAGMDFHLTKPLQVEKLLEVIQSIDSRQQSQ